MAASLPEVRGEELESWVARGPRPSTLLRQNRNSLTPVLVQGGTAARRATMARAFHEQSPVHAGAFSALDCAHEESLLASALRCWLSVIERGSPDNPLRACSHGTLFLDHIECLSPETQRLLHLLLCHREEDTGCARLTVGSHVDLDEAVANGTFLPELLDGVDKIRIVLFASPEEA
jgi:DNA-binding NtrC family response regulator